MREFIFQFRILIIISHPFLVVTAIILSTKSWLPPPRTEGASFTGFIRGILRGVRYAKSLRVLFLHRRSPSWTTLVLYSRAVFIFNEPTNCLSETNGGAGLRREEICRRMPRNFFSSSQFQRKPKSLVFFQSINFLCCTLTKNIEKWHFVHRSQTRRLFLKALEKYLLFARIYLDKTMSAYLSQNFCWFEDSFFNSFSELLPRFAVTVVQPFPSRVEMVNRTLFYLIYIFIGVQIWNLKNVFASKGI